jgi:hypothetical protein
MRRSLAVLTALLALFAAWQSDPPGAPAQDEGQAWGTIKGKVVFGGAQLPKKAPLDEVKDNKDQKHCLANGPLFDPTWVVNEKNKGVRYICVWLEDPDGNALPVHADLKEIKVKKVVIDQPQCLFVPHALAMREGQILVAKNSSPIPHNFRWGGNPLINPGGNKVIQPNESFEINNLKAERLPVRVDCDFHKWMHAWVWVFKHPYYALTDADGNFEIKLAPAGKYRIKGYHSPKVGALGGQKGFKEGFALTIKAGAVTDVGTLEIK